MGVLAIAGGQSDTLLASAARIVTANGSAVLGFDGVTNMTVQLAVTAASGTGSPTLDVVIQHTIDNGTNWFDVAGLTFTQVPSASAPIAELKWPTTQGNVGNQLRVKYTIAGTNPSFTFSVKVFGRG